MTMMQMMYEDQAWRRDFNLFTQGKERYTLINVVWPEIRGYMNAQTVPGWASVYGLMYSPSDRHGPIETGDTTMFLFVSRKVNIR